MAEIDYPDSLPRPLNGNFSEGSVQPWVEDRGEVGAPDKRLRFTRELETFSFRIRIVTAQVAVLKEFYATDLVKGTKAFNWVHPATGVSHEVQFGGRPRLTHVSGRIWDADIDLQEI